jgi:hypothetical protein
VIVFELLKQTAGLRTNDNLVSVLRTADDVTVRWALDAGLGPQLHHATHGAVQRLPANLRNLLTGADLTAKVTHAAKADCAAELVAMCATIGVPVTLLKGISIGEQYYPSPHLRPMTDIDLLVPECSYGRVEAAALRMGYKQVSGIMGVNPHHGDPLFHATSGTRVDLHTTLFQQDSRLRQGQLFSPANVEHQSCSAYLREWPVRRLGTELQLVYIASYFVNDLARVSMGPTLVTPLIDAVRLLRVSGTTFDWDLLLTSLDNEVATASLLVLLDYLQRHRLAELPDGIISALLDRQRLMTTAECRLLGSLIHRYLVGGQRFKAFNSCHVWLNSLAPGPSIFKLLRLPWRIAFPPSYRGRLDARAQAKRIARWAAAERE